ncbi:hypothetical protein BTJ40_20730 [Microbulbifer sp. A4B17]|uniref:hypothetical protein n=1 Tax=Microbulbifer sp. A4B17 TaxID=359370 RepID=UPI000D52EAAB|nr:hypothetical protein [Microbulbifer sp. A4B17]AWF83048.1 hypothetical protein BTJ40_20730 [Microbulbifer sp. A4B17]
MSDIYKAPEANLANSSESDDSGSIEKGIAGDYSFSIGETISEAWERTSGNKGTIWVGAILYGVATIAISLVAALITGGAAAFSLGSAPESTSAIAGILYQLIVTIGCAPLAVGMTMIGIKIARDEKTSGTEVFAHFDKIVPLGIATILLYLLVGIGMVLLVIPGIYLAIAYLLTMPLVADRNLGPWEALETSRKAITKNWFAFLGFFIVTMLIVIAGGLALLIGLIWALPLCIIAIGVAYRKVFGVPNHN